MNEQEIKQANDYKKQPAGSIYTGIVVKGTEYGSSLGCVV